MTTKETTASRRFPAGVTTKETQQTQIPCGNDNKGDNSKRRFPAGMTTKKRQQQAQIPCGDDNEEDGVAYVRLRRAVGLGFVFVAFGLDGFGALAECGIR